VLAAAALLADAGDPAQPASIILVAGPVDARIDPTPVDRLLAHRPVAWFERNVLSVIPGWCRGAGRRVYPGAVQLAGLLSYLARHAARGDELFRKLVADDGDDPVRWPFYALYTGVMDLTAELFLEQLTAVFQNFDLPRHRMTWRGQPVRPEAISRALTTIEGALDDVAAVGQTAAAHALCTSIPRGLRRRHVEPGVGHFGTFHGRVWRTRILPIVHSAIRASTR
jgi:polyhydroxyalkanoate depolymerase